MHAKLRAQNACRYVVFTMLGGLFVLSAPPSPVAAHPLPPGVVADDTISPLYATVDEVRPTQGLTGIELTLYGSIAHADLRVPRGREVVVLGYSGEPYQRITDRGAVQLNLNSPTLYVNRVADGDTIGELPSSNAAPRWSTMSYGGETSWHDHRLHWMAPGEPPTFDGSDVVSTFTLQLVVDGGPIEIDASLRRRPDVPMSDYLAVLPEFADTMGAPDEGAGLPAGWFVGALVVVGPALVIARRGRRRSSERHGDSLVRGGGRLSSRGRARRRRP